MKEKIARKTTLPTGFKWWRLDHFFSLGFGLGLLPWVPGTWGTLAALPFYGLMHLWSGMAYGVGLMVLIVASIYCSGRTAQALGDNDPRAVVCDEVVGWLLVLWWLPPTLMSLGLSFLWFRFFDILKPWPIRWFDQQCSGGLGIVLDDLFAGIYALIVCLLIQKWWF